jgi:hypothetical protein
MGKFSLASSVAPSRPQKRSSEGSPAAAAAPQSIGRAVPRASQLTVVEQGPRPQRTTSRLPTSAPVFVTVYRCAENAGDVWNLYEGDQGVSLWQVQLKHEARPSMLFDLLSSFNDYLRSSKAEDASAALPGTVADLASQAGIKLVLTDGSDPDKARLLCLEFGASASCVGGAAVFALSHLNPVGPLSLSHPLLAQVGFVQWRPAFYVAGHDETALTNLMTLLDGFFVYKANLAAREESFEVRVFKEKGIDLSAWEEEAVYGHYVHELEAGAAMPPSPQTQLARADSASVRSFGV